MRQLFIYFLIILFLASFKVDSKITLDKDEAKKAFTLLNDIRVNPAHYYRELRLNKSLKITKTELIWNNDLAKVAEARAYDMAKRKYFNHVDPDGFGINYHIKKSGYVLNPEWTKNKRNNYFESIQAGANEGEEVIKLLIIDRGVPSLAHRNHLLGIGKWNSSLVDIGVGFARRNSGSKYQTYISIIIAKHN
jgi:Cysteine-rich secretory protein family